MKKIIIIILCLILLWNTFANKLDTRLNNFFEKKEQRILFNSTIKQPYKACINEQNLYKNLINIYLKAKNIDKYKKYTKLINYIINYTKNRSKYCRLVYNFRWEYHYSSFPISKNLLKDKSIFNKKFTFYVFWLLDKNKSTNINSNKININTNNNTNTIKWDKELKSLISKKNIEDSKKVNWNINLWWTTFKYNIQTVWKIEDKS